MERDLDEEFPLGDIDLVECDEEEGFCMSEQARSVFMNPVNEEGSEKSPVDLEEVGRSRKSENERLDLVKTPPKMIYLLRFAS